MNTLSTETPSRRAAVAAFALVGFITVLGAGMWLAVYSARYVPVAVSRLGAAAVSLGSIFVPATPPGLSVVPNATTTLPFPATTKSAKATSTPKTAAPQAVTPSAGKETSSVTQIGGTTAAPSLTGLPDLATTITATGYLATSSATSFIATSTIPKGARPAVRFTIKNIGTNATGAWNFSAKIPTATNYLYFSPTQQSLNPGDSVDYTLGFDQALPGNQTITITANASNAVKESDQSNDTATATVTIVGA